MSKVINVELIEQSVHNILVALGEDTNREGIKETPRRVAKMYQEVFEGMQYTNHEIAQMFGKMFMLDDEFDNTQINLIIERDISMFSFCEHHMALMYDMKVTVGYIPNGKVIGLSKIVRIVQMVGRRLQLQERIGMDIADVMQEITNSEDIAVLVTGKHSCVSMRGIKNTDSETQTTVLRGKFKSDVALQALFFEKR